MLPLEEVTQLSQKLSLAFYFLIIYWLIYACYYPEYTLVYFPHFCPPTVELNSQL